MEKLIMATAFPGPDWVSVGKGRPATACRGTNRVADPTYGVRPRESDPFPTDTDVI